MHPAKKLEILSPLLATFIERAKYIFSGKYFGTGILSLQLTVCKREKTQELQSNLYDFINILHCYLIYLKPIVFCLLLIYGCMATHLKVVSY